MKSINERREIIIMFKVPSKLSHELIQKVSFIPLLVETLSSFYEPGGSSKRFSKLL